jgi:hypothetical protein
MLDLAARVGHSPRRRRTPGQVQLHLEMSAEGVAASMDFDVDIAPSSEPVEIAGPPAGEIIDGSVDDLGALIAGS